MTIDGFNKQLTPESVLRQVSQKQIFEHYLGASISENYKIRSPFRSDSNPSCSFAKLGNDWVLKDFSTGDSWKCFKFVMDMFDISFTSALNKIHEDMNLFEVQQPVITEFKQSEYVKRTKPRIVVTTQEFTTFDQKYLSQYGITRELCNKYNVYSIRNAWMNNRHVAQYTKSTPTIGYYFGTDEKGNHKWKLYFYTSTKKRFLTNTNRIQGWVQIPDRGNHLVITKSLKDVMVIDKLGFPTIAPQGESFVFYDYIIDSLKQRFSTIHVLYDNDKAGRENAKFLKEKYDLNIIFLDEAKDISDLVKVKGILHAKKTIHKSIYRS